MAAAFAVRSRIIGKIALSAAGVDSTIVQAPAVSVPE